VTLTASAQAGYVFERWVVLSGGISVLHPSLANTSFFMGSNNVSVQAQFRPLPTFPVTTDWVGSGSAGANPTQAPEGTSVTLTATAHAGHEFVRWEVLSGGVTLSNPHSRTATFTMPNRAVSVRAHFTEIIPDPPQEFRIWVVTGSGSGSAGASQTSATPGTWVTLWANPGPGYEFCHWSGDVWTDQFAMPYHDVTVFAHFRFIGEPYMTG